MSFISYIYFRMECRCCDFRKIHQNPKLNNMNINEAKAKTHSFRGNFDGLCALCIKHKISRFGISRKKKTRKKNHRHLNQPCLMIITAVAGYPTEHEQAPVAANHHRKRHFFGCVCASRQIVRLHNAVAYHPHTTTSQKTIQFNIEGVILILALVQKHRNHHNHNPLGNSNNRNSFYSWS